MFAAARLESVSAFGGDILRYGKVMAPFEVYRAYVV